MIYLGTKKYAYKYIKKNNLKNNRKIKIKTKRKKRTKMRILNATSMASNAMTSREHKKRCALNLLVSIK